MIATTTAQMRATTTLAIVLSLTLLTLLISTRVYAEPQQRHAFSLIGEPKFPRDFTHFDWVNPDAPKGGTLRESAIGAFDSLNPFTAKGVAARGATLIYDTLTSPSPDEPSAEYCLLCEWVSYPDDYSSVTFKLREDAKFHDGRPVTPEDVIFTINAMKKAHPFFRFYYKNVTSAEKTGEHEVTFKFDSKGNRELPQIVGQIHVLPKHYWTGTDKKGNKRDLTKVTLDPPLGSGPYKIKSFDAGRSIIYERVDDYWGKDLPVNIGQWNFDEIKFDYFRDRVPSFEAFKSGNIEAWQETSANAWATQYSIPDVKKGNIKKEAIPHKRVAPMQAFVMNLRRKQFQDPRVRKAFNLAYNFEQANRTLFYNQYIRVGSYFDNSELKASGLPEGRELEILTEIKDLVPPEVFTAEWQNAKATTQNEHRNNLRQAVKLLAEAGWTRKNGTLQNDKGEKLTAEFLLVQPDFKRVVLPFTQDLKKIGIETTVRVVDSSQYKRRTDRFDFDIIVDNFGQSHSPGNEQRNYWGSVSANREGSANSVGIKNKAIDHLIDGIVFAKTRDELVAYVRALDRVLLWNYYVVPQWHFPFTRLAWWDKFGRPDKIPSQAPSVIRTWWVDPEKEKALVAARNR